MIHDLAAYLKVFGVLLLKLHLEGKSILKMKRIYSDDFFPIHLLGHLLFSYEPKNSQTRKSELMSFPAETFSETEKEIK